MKEKTRGNDPEAAKEKIKKMEAVIRGSVNYFAIAKAKSRIQANMQDLMDRIKVL